MGQPPPSMQHEARTPVTSYAVYGSQAPVSSCKHGSEQPTQYNTGDVPSKKRIWLFLVAAGVIVTVLCVGGYMYHQSCSDAVDASEGILGDSSEADPSNYFKLKPHTLPVANHSGLDKGDFLYETVPVKIANSFDTSLVSFCFEKVTEDRFHIWMTFLKTVLKSTGVTSAEKEALKVMIANLEPYREQNEDGYTWFAYATISSIDNKKDKPVILPAYIESFMMVLGVQHLPAKAHTPVVKCPEYLGTVKEGNAHQHQDLPKLLNGWAAKATLVIDPAAREIVLPKYNWIPNMDADPVNESIGHTCANPSIIAGLYDPA